MVIKMDSTYKTKRIENEKKENKKTFYESHYHLLKNFLILTINFVHFRNNCNFGLFSHNPQNNIVTEHELRT
jgi:hypothetical protein